MTCRSTQNAGTHNYVNKYIYCDMVKKSVKVLHVPRWQTYFTNEIQAKYAVFKLFFYNVKFNLTLIGDKKVGDHT